MVTRSGTEIAVRELAPALARAGVKTVVDTRGAGPTSTELDAGGVQVSDDRSTLAAPDIIHGPPRRDGGSDASLPPSARVVWLPCRSMWHGPSSRTPATAP